MSGRIREIIYTIGHSNRILDEFNQLLKTNGIQLLADVRTVPKSRANPQFNQDSLVLLPEETGIGYIHLPELGGWRRSKLDNSPNTGWRSPGFKNYADYMLTEEFQAGIARLISLALERRTAIMCAEAVPWRCHRNLISDALVARECTVRHIISQNSVQEHSLTSWAVVSGNSITYPASRESGK